MKLMQKQIKKWLMLTVMMRIIMPMWRLDKDATSHERDMATFQFCPGMVSTQMRALGALNLHGNTSLSL